jgi:phospholipid transport system substrate-binding protein
MPRMMQRARQHDDSLVPRATVTGTRAFLLSCAFTAAISIVTIASSVIAMADTDPMDTVKTTVNQVLDVLRNRSTSPAERGRQLITTVNGKFDFADMARSTLGYHWRDLTEAQQSEFIPLFTSFMEDAYLSKIEGYSGQTIEFKGENRTEPGYAQVNSLVVQPNGAEPIHLDYQLKQDGGDWKVYDVAVDNISITENYANQFNRVIQNQGYDALVKAMRAKEQELTASLAAG